MVLFSLSANAGAALAAAVVQPGAVGLDVCSYAAGTSAIGEASGAAGEWRDEPARRAAEEGQERRRRRDSGRGGFVRGVVFECLDARVLEGAIVSAMGRLGLGVRCRSRWGAVRRWSR